MKEIGSHSRQRAIRGKLALDQTRMSLEIFQATPENNVYCA